MQPQVRDLDAVQTLVTVLTSMCALKSEKSYTQQATDAMSGNSNENQVGLTFLRLLP